MFSSSSALKPLIQGSKHIIKEIVERKLKALPELSKISHKKLRIAVSKFENSLKN